MMIKLGLLLLASAFTIHTVQAQKVKSDDIEYRYIKLPMTPLPSSIKNYQSSIVAAYEAENQKRQETYNRDLQNVDADYQKELDLYPARVKEAEDRYAAEMAEWNKKSTASKLIDKQVLGENNKPVKNLPSQPYRKTPTAPTFIKSYDYAALASTYFVLDGYQNNPDNAVRIEVTLNGFEYTAPRQVITQRSTATTVNGKSVTQQTNYYNVEFTYRHTMSVKVTSPEGKEILFLTPQELNNYKTYKSPESTKSIPINEDQLVKTYEEKILQENLIFINNLVNDKIGFTRELRKSTLSYVKSKDATYGDLTSAFNDADSGLKSLVDDSEMATNKLQNAIQTWNKALEESDVNNKKARIDQDVTIMIYFNLLEVHFALGEYDPSQKILSSLNMLSLGKSERKLKDEYEALFMDLKKRIAANKNVK